MKVELASGATIEIPNDMGSCQLVLYTTGVDHQREIVNVHASGGYTIASHDVRVGSEWVPLAMGTEPRVFIDGKRVL